MNITSFPGCCVAYVIYGFGGGHNGQQESHTKQEVILGVKKYLNGYEGCALIFAIPTATQPNAIAAFEELGFYTAPDSDTCYATGNKNHKIHPFFMPLREWDEKEFDARYNPEEDTYVNKANYGVAGIPPQHRAW